MPSTMTTSTPPPNNNRDDNNSMNPSSSSLYETKQLSSSSGRQISFLQRFTPHLGGSAGTNTNNHHTPKPMYMSNLTKVLKQNNNDANKNNSNNNKRTRHSSKSTLETVRSSDSSSSSSNNRSHDIHFEEEDEDHTTSTSTSTTVRQQLSLSSVTSTTVAEIEASLSNLSFEDNNSSSSSCLNSPSSSSPSNSSTTGTSTTVTGSTGSSSRNSIYCSTCHSSTVHGENIQQQQQQSNNASIETALTDLGITVCSCSKSSNEIEKNILRTESLSRLLSTASQLLIEHNDYEGSLLRYCIALEMMQENSNNHNHNTNYQLANLCYTCGQLSRKVHDYYSAANYYRQELGYIASYTTAQSNNKNHAFVIDSDLCMAKGYHALAKLHQYDMGDANSALEYYEQALSFEQAAFDKLKKNLYKCTKCNKNTTNINTTTTNSTIASFQTKKNTGCKNYTTGNLLNKPSCRHIHTKLLDVQHQIQETKRSIGRIHFQNGNLDRALLLTIRK